MPKFVTARFVLSMCFGVLLVMCGVLSGCGDDSSTTDTTAPSVGVSEEEQVVATVVASGAESRLLAAMDRWVEDAGTGSVTVAVLGSGGSSWTGAAGVVDAATGAEAEPDQLMRAGSITKSFVGAVILQLVEEGRLELDTPAVALWPDFTGDERITVRHLLGHTSGIYNYTDCLQDQACLWDMFAEAAGLSDLGDCRDQACFSDLLEEAGLELVWNVDVPLARALTEPASFPPGDGYQYSNTGYLVLCKIIESATGQPAHTELRARLLDPLGLNDAYLDGSEDGPPFAPNHGDSRVADPTADIDLFFCSGALVSTVEDLAVFGDALWGGNLLEDASLEAMVTPGREPTDGLATQLEVIASQPAWGHRGGAPGFLAAVYHFPESGVTVAAMSNDGSVAPGQEQAAIERINGFIGEIAEIVLS